MLAKSKRLNVSKSFGSIASFKKVQTENLTLYYRFGEGESLVGVAIRGREFSGAVERNRAKRIVFGLAEEIYQDLRSGTNLIIMPRSTVLKQGREKLKNEILDVKDLYSAD